jgi:hypothetical protein
VNERVGAPAAPVVLPNEQQGEKSEHTLPLQNPAYSRIRSNSIDQLRQRIDRRNAPSRNRLSIDPCASSDVASTRRGEQAGVQNRNPSASEASVPSIPSSFKIRADPPSIKDCQLQSEPNVSTPGDPTLSLLKGSKTVGIHQSGHPEFTQDSTPAICADSPPTNRADPPSRIECAVASEGSPELTSNYRSSQLYDRQPEGDVSRPAAVVPGRPLHDNKRVANGDPIGAHESVCSPDSHSLLSQKSDCIVSIGRHDEIDKDPSDSIRQKHENTMEQKSLLRNHEAFPYNETHVVPDHSSVCHSPRLRRSIIAMTRSQSRSRRSLGDEKVMSDTPPPAVREDLTGGSKVSKLDLLRRLSSRKSLDRAPNISKTATTARNEGANSQRLEKSSDSVPDIVETVSSQRLETSTDSVPDIVETVSTSSEEAVEVPRSQGMKKQDAASKKKASHEWDAEVTFPLEILYPSEKHKTYGGLVNGYTVWCSYGNERPTRYGSWIPPAKLFDTTYKSQSEANDRAKYLFFWENPFRVEPDELEKRSDALAETVKKNCKSFDSKVNGGTETWRVGVVPSAVFEWLDRAEIRRHDSDEAFGSEFSISAASTVD